MKTLLAVDAIASALAQPGVSDLVVLARWRVPLRLP
jgi:hypothetical protein